MASGEMPPAQIYIPEDEGCSQFQFETGDRVTVRLHPIELGSPNPGKAAPTYMTEPGTRICRVLQVLTSPGARVGPLVTTTRAGADIHSVCSIRIEYHGGGVVKTPFRDENCVHASM